MMGFLAKKGLLIAGSSLLASEEAEGAPLVFAAGGDAAAGMLYKALMRAGAGVPGLP